jgi:hypothetical protein
LRFAGAAMRATRTTLADDVDEERAMCRVMCVECAVVAGRLTSCRLAAGLGGGARCENRC